MEHNTDLWSCPYNDEKYGEEKGASFKYFKEFLNCKTPRSLVYFHKVLSKNLSKKGMKRKPSYQTLQEYSAKWKWFMRAEAYDNYIHDVDDQKLKEEIRTIRRDRILAAKERMQNQDKLFNQLMHDEEMATNQKVYGASKNSEAIKNETSAFNEIVNEGKTKVDAEVESTGETQLNITGNLSIEEKLERYETYFKELNKQTESNTS